jgi:hypothetical protein
MMREAWSPRERILAAPNISVNYTVYFAMALVISEKTWTMEELFRYGLKTRRKEFLTSQELRMTNTAPLWYLVELAHVANARIVLRRRHPTRFST